MTKEDLEFLCISDEKSWMDLCLVNIYDDVWNYAECTYKPPIHFILTPNSNLFLYHKNNIVYGFHSIKISKILEKQFNQFKYDLI